MIKRDGVEAGDEDEAEDEAGDGDGGVGDNLFQKYFGHSKKLAKILKILAVGIQ